jgi:voltage-gated potassium channel
MLKLIRYSATFSLLWAVLRDELRSIAALLFILILTVTVSGTLMFLAEGDEQPDVFTSIPVGMWWAIETLTTVGYGDLVPATVAGRMLGGVVSIVGIGTLALFSGLITIGFLDQLKVYREQHPPANTNGSGKLSTKEQQPAEYDAVRADLSDLNGPTLNRAAGRTSPLAVCPHCGAALGDAAPRFGSSAR